VRHYSERGYHFLGISDHNIYQTGRKVKKFQKKSSSQMAILEEYRKTWPRNFECKEGENGDLEVLVQPLSKMREMFDKIVENCEAIEEENNGLGRGIYDELEETTGSWFWEKTTSCWTEETLNAMVTLCNEAKAAVNADATLTDAQKTAILNRITKESLFPRYVLCTTYASKYSSSTKKSMRQAFKADATALGLTLYREADGLLSDLYSNWGV
jgi:hypothetical protein